MRLPRSLIGGGTVQVDPKKITAVQDWRAPKTVKDIQSFLGFANYYRRFVKDNAKIATPMTRLIRKTGEWNSGQEQQQAFDRLTTLLTHAPVLRLADSSRPYVLATDASDYALGAVLMQDFGHGNQPVAYTSRQLHGAGLNSTRQKIFGGPTSSSVATLKTRPTTDRYALNFFFFGKVVELWSATNSTTPAIIDVQPATWVKRPINVGDD
jgi:hypothetical protein